MKNALKIAATSHTPDKADITTLGELAQATSEKSMPGATHQIPELKVATKSAFWEKNTRIPYLVRNDEMTLHEFLIY